MTKDTPRTDDVCCECETMDGCWCVSADFARELERDLSECRAVLRELHDDIQGRIDDGDKFNPGTLRALSAARAILPPDTTGEGEGS